MEVPPAKRIEVENRENWLLRDRGVGRHRPAEPADSRQMGPRTGPGDHHGDQHDVRKPDRERFGDGHRLLDDGGRFALDEARAELAIHPLFRRCGRAAEASNRLRPPNLDEQEQNPERNQRPAQVRQVRTQIMRHGPLPGDIRKRAHDRQRPSFDHSVPAAHQIDQHPGRQQRQNRNDASDGSGKRHQGKTGHGRQSQNRRSQRAVGDRRIVRQSRHADRIQIRDSQSHQNRHHHRPRISESHQSFQQRPERPGQHDGLDPDVGGGVMDHPFLEPLEPARQFQGVEDD